MPEEKGTKRHGPTRNRGKWVRAQAKGIEGQTRGILRPTAKSICFAGQRGLKRRHAGLISARRRETIACVHYGEMLCGGSAYGIAETQSGLAGSHRDQGDMERLEPAVQQQQ